MLYDTVLLRTFVAICDSGSFTKAARAVNLTQSAVSLHVKRLENQVGTRLVVAGLWTLAIQSAGTAGILAALEAGLAISVFPEFNLPPTLKALGAAEALPALPDFEFVLRRSRSSSPAADHLAEMIVNFFQLSKALRPDAGMNYKQRAQLLLRTNLEA